MKRGEIWTAAGTGYGSKPRPVLVIQRELYDLESVTILPLTSTLDRAQELRVELSASEGTGLQVDSAVMIDKIMTLKRVNIRQHIGQVDSADLTLINRQLAVFLGIA